MQCVKEEKRNKSQQKRAHSHPGYWYQYSIPVPLPGNVYPAGVTSSKVPTGFPSKKYIKKKTRPQFGGSDTSETYVCQCLKLQGACAKKKTIEMDHVWATWPKPTPVSCVVDAASLKHRRSSISWSDVRKTGYVAHLLVAAKR